MFKNTININEHGCEINLCYCIIKYSTFSLRVKDKLPRFKCYQFHNLHYGDIF